MLYPRIIPSLLLKDRGLVKGIKFDKHRYIGDPINAIKIFNEKEADELLLLDIGASQEGRTIPIDLVERIAGECFMPFGVGGGIKKIEEIRDLLQAGAEKVCINTAAIENPELIRMGSEVFGSQSMVVSIDVKKRCKDGYQIFSNSGTKEVKYSLDEFLDMVVNFGAGEILINSIDRDGTMEGYDLDLIRYVTDHVSVPVIASGGAKEMQDLIDVIKEGRASAAAAGSMFVFQGKKRGILINYISRIDVSKLF